MRQLLLYSCAALLQCPPMGATASRPAPETPHMRLRIASHAFKQRYQHTRQQLAARLSFRSRRVHAVSCHDPPTLHGSLNVVPALLSSFHWGHTVNQSEADSVPKVADAAVQVHPSDLLAPVVVNSSPTKWRKGDCIGRGSFGNVFMGFNCVTGELLAVKEVTTCVRDSPHQREALQQLEQEVRHDAGLCRDLVGHSRPHLGWHCIQHRCTHQVLHKVYCIGCSCSCPAALCNTSRNVPWALQLPCAARFNHQHCCETDCHVRHPANELHSSAAGQRGPFEQTRFREMRLWTPACLMWGWAA